MIFVKGENPLKIDLGTVLVASEEMDDEYFKNSVILISAISQDAVLGFIINRPIFVPVKELFDDVNEKYRSTKRRIFAGGPVDESELSMISFSLVGGREIVQGIRLGGRWKTIEEMLDSDEYENRLFLGYASWSVNQLIDEIVFHKSWVVYDNVPVILVFAGVDNDRMQTSREAISALDVLSKKR
jgi:putative transcriptional regulator